MSFQTKLIDKRMSSLQIIYSSGKMNVITNNYNDENTLVTFYCNVNKKEMETSFFH